jgi:hypothetical protein
LPVAVDEFFAAGIAGEALNEVNQRHALLLMTNLDFLELEPSPPAAVLLSSGHGLLLTLGLYR